MLQFRREANTQDAEPVMARTEPLISPSSLFIVK